MTNPKVQRSNPRRTPRKGRASTLRCLDEEFAETNTTLMANIQSISIIIHQSLTKRHQEKAWIPPCACVSPINHSITFREEPNPRYFKNLSSNPKRTFLKSRRLTSKSPSRVEQIYSVFIPCVLF